MAGEYIEFHNNAQPALNETNVNRMQQLIKQDIQGSVSGDTLPVGVIMPYGSDTIPDNWLLCNGQAVSRTDYVQLFNTIGTTFGVGDGFTTFNLPDLRDRVPIGKDSTDTDFDALGKTAGEREHTLTIEEMPSHNHISRDDAAGLFEGWGSKSGSGWVNAAHQNTNGGNWETANTGGGQPFNVTQPSIATNYIIKATQSAGVVATVVDNLLSTSATNALSANQGKVLVDRMSYSTTEKVVGTWYNGKTLYEITIVATKTSGTDLRVTLNSTIEDAFVHDGHLKSQTTDGPIYALDRNEGNDIFTRSEIDILNNQFVYKSSTGDYTNGTVYATIRYTKPDIQNS